MQAPCFRQHRFRIPLFAAPASSILPFVALPLSQPSCILLQLTAEASKVVPEPQPVIPKRITSRKGAYEEPAIRSQRIFIPAHENQKTTILIIHNLAIYMWCLGERHRRRVPSELRNHWHRHRREGDTSSRDHAAPPSHCLSPCKHSPEDSSRELHTWETWPIHHSLNNRKCISELISNDWLQIPGRKATQRQNNAIINQLSRRRRQTASRGGSATVGSASGS